MKLTLPRWLEHLLGEPTAGSGEGTLWLVEFGWSWAPGILLLFVACSIAWVALVYTREVSSAGRGYRSLLAALRMASIALVLFMLMGVTVTRLRTGLPTLVILVDDSASMGIVDSYDREDLREFVVAHFGSDAAEMVSRLDLAMWALTGQPSEVLSLLTDRYRLAVYFVSESAREQVAKLPQLRESIGRLKPEGQATRLESALRTVLSDLRGNRPSAVVLLTDGNLTDGESLEEVARLASTKGVPLFPIGLGRETADRDIDVSDLLVDEIVFVNDVVNFQVFVTAYGFAGRQVEVRLKHAGGSDVLTRTALTLHEDGQRQLIALPYRPPNVGDFEFIVEVEPLDEELRKENNRQQRAVSVREERVRVLYVQEYPSWEFRYLKNMLDREPTVDLYTLLHQGDLEYAQDDSIALEVFPVQREDLFAYDVILLGDVPPDVMGMSGMKMLREFVERKGGGIAFLAGPRHMPLAYRDTPLAGLFPIDLDGASVPSSSVELASGFQVRPTQEGLATGQMQLGDSVEESARIWQHLPELYWSLEVLKLKPAAHVLAEHPQRVTSEGEPQPLICLQYFGAGKVLLHGIDSTWRWRFRVGDRYLARYWVQAVRHLGRSRLVGKNRSAELTVDRREYQQGDTVRFRARFATEQPEPAADTGVVVVVEQDNQARRRVTLTRSSAGTDAFEGELAGLSEGTYHARIATPALSGQPATAEFRIATAPGELAHTRMNRSELEAAARATKGRFYDIASVGQLPSDLPKGQQEPIETSPPRPLWNHWIVVLAFISTLTTEWILRKRQGML